MKILCVSDQIDPLVYSGAIKERFADMDYVLSAGDLPMDYLGFIVSCLNKPLLFVFGNHNLQSLHHFRPGFDDRFAEKGAFNEMDADSSGAIHLGFKLRKEGPMLFAGLDGSLRYNKGRNQYSDFEMFLNMLKLAPRLYLNRILYGRYLDILLTHAPPEGIHDKSDPCHRGFRCLLWFMRTFKPRYLIHGHIHLYDLNDVRSTRYGETLVVNAYSHFIIDTGANA